MTYAYSKHSRACHWLSYISTKASTVCFNPDYDSKLPDFYASRKSVSINATQYVIIPPAKPSTGFCGMV
ncbi:MAG: hypothetical protein Q4C37_07600 [Bacteroidales bacterium]|nr:hypothetical protein [Bacteroidales bacterium]